MNISNGRHKPLDEHAAGRRIWLGALGVLLAIAATVALALYQFVPPAVVPADAPKTEFSAERAMPHLWAIAREPHPVGSPENARVRDYLKDALNADSGEANWATLDPKLDQWTGRFLREDTEARTVGELYGGDDPTKILTSHAPVAPLKPPELELLGQETNGATRTLHLHLVSPREAWRATILPAKGVDVLGWEANGGPPQDVGDESFAYTALPPEGVDLDVKVRASGPVRFTVIDQTNGLPRIPGVTLPKRPETVMPAPLPAEAETFAGYPTFVSKSFVFS